MKDSIKVKRLLKKASSLAGEVQNLLDEAGEIAGKCLNEDFLVSFPDGESLAIFCDPDYPMIHSIAPSIIEAIQDAE